jgi:sortase A
MATTTEAPYERRFASPPPPPARRTLLISAPVPTEPIDPGRIIRLVVLWAFVAVMSMAVTLYLLGPVFQQRAQHGRLESYRERIAEASEEAFGIGGVSVPTKAPELGDSVGIVEIGSIQVQQVVVEGVGPSQTAIGPGHVPGTAGLGQRGNSVIVGRRSAFGGPLGPLGLINRADSVLVTTTQGFVVYNVESVDEVVLREPDPEASNLATSSGSGSSSGAGTAGGSGSSSGSGSSDILDQNSGENIKDIDQVFGATDDTRLTIVTSASAQPLNESRATVVVAKMEGLPYAKTPQNGRTDSQTGVNGDASAWTAFALVAMAYAAAVGAALFLYRHSSPLTAYLLTAPVLLCFTVVGAETIARLLPAWM